VNASKYNNRIREIREAKGWTQEDLVEEIEKKTRFKISQQNISKIELGQNTSLKILSIIAKALDVSLSGLLISEDGREV